MTGAEDIFVNCGGSIARDLVCGVINEARYCCCFNNLVRDLKKEKEKLLKHKKRVDVHIKRAEKETQKIDDDDKDWFEEADKLEKQVQKLEATVEKYQSCFGKCPNWICRYLLGRQLAEKKDDVKQHYNERPKYGGIKRLTTLTSVYCSSDKFMRFESRQSAHEQLIRAIKDDEVSTIGLYGLGGCGKTTLAKEVGQEAQQLFNYNFAFVEVSRNEVWTIQKKIASSIKFNNLIEEEETERAKRLSMRLSNANERFLIILDDIWKKLDFEAIGIPLGKNCNSCKVLITTRSLSVCKSMDCQPKIVLSSLSFDESWDLFQKHAHITNETFDDQKDLAKKITEKCGGLPVGIVAVASTLKGKNTVAWEVALNTLEESRPMNIQEGLINPYKCLKLSYDNLTSEEAKCLFLLCSTFPKDWKIPYDVIMIGSGLGVFGRVKSSAKTRNQGREAKNILIDSCLLLEAEDDKELECVKMHDLVHDVAFWIADEEKKGIMRIAKKENSSEEDLTTQDTQIRYLWCDKFPNKLDFTTLEFLCFSTDSEHVEVPFEFFERQNKIRVLILANESSKKMLQLPNSIRRLTNLRCLVLFGWELNDISFLENLKALESLALHKCRFRELPIAIGQLINLSMLNVSECEIESDPLKVITSYSELEELYFTRNKVFDWEFDQETAAEFLNNLSTPRKLLNYKIEITRAAVEEFDMALGSLLRSLVIEYFDASMSNETIMHLMRKAEALSLGHIKGGCRNIIPDIFQKIGGMAELIQLCLHHSKEIEWLIDNNNLQCPRGNLFSKLSKLCIREMENLKSLYHGQPFPGLFKKLEELYVYGCNQLHGVLFPEKLHLSSLKVLKLKDCPKLTSIFTPSSAPSLSLLQNVHIETCNQLKHVITDEVNEEIVEEDDDQRTNQLPFQKLEKLVVWGCDRLEYTIPVSYVHGFVRLESINITTAHELKLIFGRCTHSNQLADPIENDFQVKLPNLKQLHLDSLPNIVSIFPENYYPDWPALCEFNLWKCPRFTIVNKFEVSSEVNQHRDPGKERSPFIGHGNQKRREMWGLQTLLDIETLMVAENNAENIFHLAGFPLNLELAPSLTPRLKSLCLDDLHELSYICKGPIQIMSLQNLVLLEIYNCRKLKSVFSTCSFTSMPQLEELIIRDCNQLEQIISDEEYQNITDSHTESCPRSTPNSCNLRSGSRTIPQTAGGISKHSCLLLCGMCRTHSSRTRLVPTSRGSRDTPQDTGGSLNLCNLKQLMIRNCPMLKSLFTLSTVRILTSLTKLKVSVCHGLKQIITCESSCESKKEESRIQSHVLILFPKLNDLDIEYCNSLECIFPVSFTEGFMKLKCISICRTPQLRSLFTPFTAKVLTSLEKLEITGCYELKEIITCDSAHEEKNQKIFQNESGFESHVSPLFRELKYLRIELCNSLKCIFPVSFIQGLPKLGFVSIDNAAQLQYLFCESSLEYSSSNQCQNMLQIKLPLLKNLSLEELPNLISICPSNCYVECPYLQEIRLLGLSNSTTNNWMRSQDRQWDHQPIEDLGTTAVKLEQGSITSESSDSEDNFNRRKKELLLLISNKVMSMFEMGISCMIPECLLYLQHIEVNGCGKLRALFPVSVLRSLPLLKELKIEKCEELEQITAEDEENENISNSCSQKACFPQLKVLIIKSCNKLKRLFSSSTSREFPKLESIIVMETSQLKEIFERGKDETEKQMEVVLPELKHLELVQLPSLTNTSQGVKILTGPCDIVHIVGKYIYVKEASRINWDVYVDLHDELCNRPTTSSISNSIEIEEESLRKPPSKNVIEVHEGLPMEKANTSTSSNLEPHNTDAMVTESAQEGPSSEEATVATLSNDLTPRNSPAVGPLVIGPLQKASHLGAVDGVQKGLPMEKATPVTSYSQVLATHVDVEFVQPVSDQRQQIRSPLPIPAAGSIPSHTIPSYQPQSINMSLSSGQTFEELIHVSQPGPAFPVPSSIPSFELDPLDELELLLTDSLFLTSTDTAPLLGPTKTLSIQKMAEDLDALFNRVLDDLYNDPAILKRLEQISSISESMMESDAPSTFVDFMKNFRTKYPQLLKDFEKNKNAVLEYEKAKTEKYNMAAQLPTIKGKTKELEDNIQWAEIADKTFVDQIEKIKQQLAELESRAQAHKMVLSSLRQNRTNMDLNTQALVEKARNLGQFISSNSSAYTQNHMNLTSLRNVWMDLKSEFVQSRSGV